MECSNRGCCVDNATTLDFSSPIDYQRRINAGAWHDCAWGVITSARSGSQYPSQRDTCVPPPFSSHDFTGTPTFTWVSGRCSMCGGDFWCVRNSALPELKFADPFRGNASDPVRERVITSLSAQIFGNGRIVELTFALQKTSFHSALQVGIKSGTGSIQRGWPCPLLRVQTIQETLVLADIMKKSLAHCFKISAREAFA